LKQTVNPSYCSSNFVPCKVDGVETYVLVPETLRHLSKCGFTVRNLPPHVTCAQRMKGNYLSSPQHVVNPVTRVFSKYYLDSNCLANSDDEYRLHVVGKHKFEVSEKVYDWFTETYGVTTDELHNLEVFLEEHIVSARGIPSVYDSILLNKMYDHYHGVV